MTKLENEMRKIGWYRSPNNQFQWYAGYQGLKRPAYPLQVNVTDKIWLVTSSYGQQEMIPLMAFENNESFLEYLENNGVIGMTPGANVWD